MSQFENSQEYVEDGLRDYVMQVFTRMATGLAITAVIAYVCYKNLISGGLIYRILINNYRLTMFATLIAELGLCIGLSRNLETMKNSTARLMFYLYAAITGFTFSVLPLSFGEATIFTAFVFAAVMFVACLIIGKTTKVDLTKFSGLLIGGLLAMVICTLLSFIIPGLMNSIMWSYIGVILFLGLTAYDMQRIKGFYYSSMGYNDELAQNLAVYGAFQLYLDFINLFLYILRILGNRRKK